MKGGKESGNTTQKAWGVSFLTAERIDCLQADLAGMIPLSPHVSVEPQHPQDMEELILPTGGNKTQGRLGLTFFTIGRCYMEGTTQEIRNGLQLGLKENRTGQVNAKVNMTTEQGALQDILKVL